jgi:hypothetical protein
MCWMGIVVLGVCGVKTAGEGVLGNLAGVSLKQPIWDRGWGCTPHCVLTLQVLLAYGGYELTQVRKQVDRPSHGTFTYTPPRREWG